MCSSSLEVLAAFVAVSRTVCRYNHHLLCVSPTTAFLLFYLRKGLLIIAQQTISADAIAEI